MSQLSNAARLLIASVFSFSAPAFAVLAEGSPQSVTIRTLAKTGKVVAAKVEISIGNGEWKYVEGVSVPGGGVQIFVEKCDGTVRFMAYKTDNQGVYTRENPEDPRFCQPEVVFDDYVWAVAGLEFFPQGLGDQNNWVAALGGDAAAKRYGPEYARQFEQALQAGNLGYIAIASSEVAASLRAAGKYEAAKPFEVLSYQSTLSGIMDAKGEAVDLSKLLIVPPGTNSAVLSPEATEIIKKYQVETLGIPDTSAEYGKTGWSTMKSLAGGQEVQPSKWKLYGSGIDQFDAKVFYQGG